MGTARLMAPTPATGTAPSRLPWLPEELDEAARRFIARLKSATPTRRIDRSEIRLPKAVWPALQALMAVTKPRPSAMRSPSVLSTLCQCSSARSCTSDRTGFR